MRPDSLQSHRLAEVCSEYQVRKLFVFGSAAAGRMNAESDLDFLVEFDALSPDGAFDRFMGLKEALEALYNRRVDLLTLKPFRNRLFQAEVDESKVLLYAA